ncbi:MAG: plasmid recombination protein [Oscillospiraceae bacterium]|nr:plasmid recombination protein [Oscillospiraceae bacterium]
MARNDGVHRTTVRNANLTKNQIGNVQRHNEREKESYVNQDIIPERTPLNVHFKTPSGSYQEIFDAMVEEKTISTRGLKSDAHLFGELIFDVNSAYFHNHGGYEYARQFYADAYRAAVDIVGGEQYILSAVMHADERNRAMSEALGQDVYHYHLHVVYIPVVEKQILWSKRCKDKALVGTVKEMIMQVSSSKKWLSKPALDEAGNPILQRNGKPVLKKSYSVLQDDFFQHMRAAGYTDVERGERGSNEAHLTVTQFKVMQEEKRLEGLTERIQQSGTELAQVQQQLTSGHDAIQQMESDTRKAEKAADAAEKKMTQAERALRTQSMTFMKIDSMGKKTLTGNIAFAPDEARELKELAKKGVTADRRVSELEEKVARAQKDAGIWKRRYEKLLDQVQDYLTAVKKAPERVADFLRRVIQERDIPQRRQPTRTHQRSMER